MHLTTFLPDPVRLHPAYMPGGGCKGMQCMDAVVSGQMMIEKALDSCSHGALAQADIEAYYSHIPLSLLGSHLLSQQYGLAWTGAALRAHA